MLDKCLRYGLKVKAAFDTISKVILKSMKGSSRIPNSMERGLCTMPLERNYIVEIS